MERVPRPSHLASPSRANRRRRQKYAISITSRPYSYGYNINYTAQLEDTRRRERTHKKGHLFYYRLEHTMRPGRVLYNNIVDARVRKPCAVYVNNII